MDYLYFATGFLFLASAANVIILGRTRSLGLAEMPLVFFGLLTGLFFWIQLVGLLVPGAAGLSQFRAFLMISASVSLFESGRLMFPWSARNRSSLVIYLLPMLLVAVLSLLPAPPPATAAAGMAFGIPGALLLAAGFFYTAAKFQAALRLTLRLAGAGIFLFAVALGVARGNPAVDPETALVHAFPFLLGLAVALAAALYSTALWFTYHVARVAGTTDETPGARPGIPGSRELWIGAVAILLLGGVFTHWLGEQESRERKMNLLFETDLLREALDPNVLMLLSGRPDDVGTWAHSHVREQLMRFCSLFAYARFVYLVGRDDAGQAVFFADSEIKSSPLHSPPGAIHSGPDSNRDLDRVFGGKKWVGGPDRDAHGVWITAMVPIPLPNRGEPLILGVDVEAGSWVSLLARSRLLGISGTLSLLLVVFGGFAAMRIHLESRENVSAARRRLEMALDGASMAAWEWHANTSLFDVDHRWSELVGGGESKGAYSLGDFLARVDRRFRPALEQAFQSHLRGATEEVQLEFPLCSEDGSAAAWLEIRGQTSHRTKTGDPLTVSGTLQAIDERVKMRNELLSKKNRLDVLVQNFSGAIMVEGPDRLVYLANQRLCKLVGLTVGEVVGGHSGKVLARIAQLCGDPDRALAQYAGIFAAGREVHGDVIELKDSRYFLRDFVPIRGTDQPLGYFWQFRDISQERRNTKILESVAMVNSCLIGGRLEGEGWHEPLELLGEATGADRAYVFRNHPCPHTGRPLLSQVAEWNSGHSSPQISNPALQNVDYAAAGFQRLYDDLSQGIELNSLVSDLPPKQREFLESQNVISILLMPVFTGAELWGFIGFDECRTARVWQRGELALLRSAAAAIGLRLSRQRSEDELRLATEDARRAAQEAEQANRAKSTFLATMSHEIRTPLNAVIGMTSLLQETQLDATQKTYAATVLSASNTLLDLIKDILDYSKIESGRFDLHPEPFSLAAAVSETLEVLAPQAGEKQLRLDVSLPPLLPAVVIGDRVRLKQVLLNLLSNAVKFTEAGSVSLEVSATRMAGTGWNVRFCIRDTGIGIPPAIVPKLFQPFLQADSSITRRYGGTGLGLAISSKLIDLMGGKLTVQSEIGIGSEFAFALVLDAVPAGDGQIPVVAGPDSCASTSDAELERPENAAPADDAEALKDLRVLVAEDNPNNQNVMRLMLRRYGCSPRIVDNGAKALEELRDGRFDLVILDLQMPVLDGISTARAIHEQYPDPATRPYLLALTANAFEEDRDACIEAGFDRYLAKPVAASLLRDVLLDIADSSK